MTNRKNKVPWIYPEWWPRENKVRRIISVLQYMFCIYHKVETWCLQRNSFGVLSEEKRKYKYEAKHALKGITCQFCKIHQVKQKSKYYITSWHWKKTIGDDLLQWKCVYQGWWLKYTYLTKSFLQNLHTDQHMTSTLNLTLCVLIWVRSKGLIYILLTYM